MNDKNYVWFLEDGSCIEGESAVSSLICRASSFKRLSDRIDRSLSRISSYNSLFNTDDPYEFVMENGEHLAWIQMELESLLLDVSSVLGD